MQGGVNYNGSTLLSGGINVNTTGNIQALNVQVTENGERTITPPEGVDGYAPITIDTKVPIPEPVLDTLNVNSNGTYTPPSGVSGYNQVNVNVPQPTPVLDDITITANGTYTPPSGVDGYDEITVNVSQDVDIQPLTRTITTNGTTIINASDLNVDGFDPVTITTAVDGYTIKTLANTPISIASFNDGTSNPLKSLKVDIEPQQAGSGDPSPTNVRPISGWTEEVITVTDDLQNPTVTQTTAIPFKDSSDNPITVYGGDVDVVNGGGKSNLAYIELPRTGWTQEGDYTGVFTTYAIKADTPYPQLICSNAVRASSYNDVVNNEGKIGLSASRVLWHTTFATVEELEQYLANNTVQIAYELSTPLTIQLIPTSIKSLDGVNNVSASTGDVEELKYFADL